MSTAPPVAWPPSRATYAKPAAWNGSAASWPTHLAGCSSASSATARGTPDAALRRSLFDPAQVGQVSRDPAGVTLGPASDGWQPCSAPGRVWTDPELVLRFVCAPHRRQLTPLHAADLASRIRWARPGVPTHRPTQQGVCSLAS